MLGGFLAAQSPSWRAGVSVVVTDMAECYRVAVRQHLPHARHVADRFHVIRGFAKVLVSQPAATPSAARSADPMNPIVFGARFLLMKRMDRLSGEEMARMGALFDVHPDLGVVWGLVQRFHVVFCAENDADAERALDWFTDAYQAAGVNLGQRHHHVLSVGHRVNELSQDRRGHQRGLGGREHPHRGAGAHGLRVRLENQLSGPSAVVLLRPSTGAGGLSRHRR